MSFIDDMAVAEARHKRDGFDLQWCPISLDGKIEGGPNWLPVKIVGPAPCVLIIEHLVLCERPSGANAEANHAAFQKSRDRVAAELAQYDQVESIDDVRPRPITTREEFAELMDELDEKDRK